MIKCTYLFKVDGKYLAYYNPRESEIRLSVEIRNAKVFQGNPRTQLKKLISELTIDRIEVLELQLQETSCMRAGAERFLKTGPDGRGRAANRE